MSATPLTCLPPMPRLIESLSSTGLFRAGSVVIARAPGRLDVMGGIADYSGSLVCELPLLCAAGVGAQRREDDRIICRSAQMDRTVEIDAVALTDRDPAAVRQLVPDADAWARYPVGCVWWMVQHGAPADGLTLLIDSDVPLGAGVSSSAAIEVAVMTALCRLFDRPMSSMSIAAACQHVENHVVGAPCGVMDLVTSAMGVADAMLEILCQQDEEGLPASVLGHVPVPEGLRFIGIHSGVTHEVSGDPYTDTRVAAFMAQKIAAAMMDPDPTAGYLANINAVHYRTGIRNRLPETMTGEAFLAEYGGTNDPVTVVSPDKTYPVRAAADHHVLEMSRTGLFIGLLRDLDRRPEERTSVIESAGQLMYESHHSYGDNARLGHPMTDRLVAMVAEVGPTAGFYGAKTTGGGGGGTVAILMRDDDAARDTVTNIRKRYEAETGRETILFDRSGPGAAAVGVETIDLT